MGQILVEVLSADIPGFLDALGTAGVIMEDLSFPDMLTIRFRIPGSAWKRIRSVAQSRGAAVQIVARRGLWWKIATLRRRPVLLAGVGLAIALALFLPGGQGRPVHRDRPTHGLVYNVGCTSSYRFENGKTLLCGGWGEQCTGAAEQDFFQFAIV